MSFAAKTISPTPPAKFSFIRRWAFLLPGSRTFLDFGTRSHPPEQTPWGHRREPFPGGRVSAQALTNYLALLGWSGEDGREIFPLGELVKKFSLKRVSRSPAIFNFDKLNWVNRAHLKGSPGKKPWRLAGPSWRNPGSRWKKKIRGGGRRRSSGMGRSRLPRPTCRAAAGFF